MTGDIGRGLDLGGMSDELHQVAADLHRTADQVGQAAAAATARTFEAVSTDGTVRVTASGARRVTGLELAPEVLRGEAETVGAVLRIALNEALRRARVGAQAALLDGLPPSLRPPVEQGLAEARAAGEEQS